MKKILFLFIFILCFGNVFLETNENFRINNDYIHFNLSLDKFTARINTLGSFNEMISQYGGRYDYNFGEDKPANIKGYLQNDNCELTYKDNILNANWSGEEENIFGFLKGKNEKLAKDILKANLMMKVQVNYTYDGGNNNSYIYIDDDGVDLNEIKRNLRKDLLKKKLILIK